MLTDLINIYFLKGNKNQDSRFKTQDFKKFPADGADLKAKDCADKMVF